MSTFGGKLVEYDHISLDRFDGSNLLSTTYFLSHFHKDHTVGLSYKKFEQHLKNGNGSTLIYCSDVTKVLLLADAEYKHLEPYIKTLKINEATQICVQDPSDQQITELTVTLLPAKHCPGSVMFLLEGNNGTVLYTGDFRWPVGESSTQPALHNDDRVKTIDSAYVDTTFCFPEAYYIPPHDDCVAAVVHLCREWFYKGGNHHVFISTQRYGHQQLLADVARKLGTKVHVSQERCDLYDQIDGLDDVFTADEETQLHACHSSFCSRIRHRQACDASDIQIRTIRPSTMWFVHNTKARRAVVRQERVIRVCYCFHSSYSEVKDLVSYLNPTRVYPNVVPPSHANTDRVQRTLNSFLGTNDQLNDSSYQAMGRLHKKLVVPWKHQDSTSDSDELSLTPKKKKVPTATLR